MDIIVVRCFYEWVTVNVGIYTNNNDGEINKNENYHDNVVRFVNIIVCIFRKSLEKKKKTTTITITTIDWILIFITPILVRGMVFRFRKLFQAFASYTALSGVRRHIKRRYRGRRTPFDRRQQTAVQRSFHKRTKSVNLVLSS